MTNNKLLLNVHEVAELLRVKENTVRVFISTGKVIPQELIVRVGRRVLFNKARFEEWITNGCKSNLTDNN